MIPTHINRQCDDLSGLLGDRVLPYLSGPTELAAPLTNLYQHALQISPDQAGELIAAAGKTGRPHTAAGDGDCTLLAIPLRDRDEQGWFAIGRVWHRHSSAIERLVDAAATAAARRYDLEVHDRSIEIAESHAKLSLRELNWVRELSTYAVDRDRTSSSAMTNRVLSQLASLISAEAMAVVPVDDEAAAEWLTAAMYTQRHWKLEDAIALCRSIKPVSAVDHSVRNGRHYDLPGGVCHSALAVQIGSTLPLGYLVAINRRIDGSHQLRRASDLNFTAAEAAMLQEAAVFFEAEVGRRQMTHESEQLIIGMLRSMSAAIEARDPYTRGHSERVARFSYHLARLVELPAVKCREIYIAGLLHDIGKIGIPDNVLLKPGRLEADETAIIQKHPVIGHAILNDVPRLQFALPCVLYHHERWDGKGYPHSLAGEDIPLPARVMAVVDAFDAMTSSRPYRSAMLIDKARTILSEGSGQQWDSELCGQFLGWLEKRPLVENTEDPTGILQDDINFQQRISIV